MLLTPHRSSQSRAFRSSVAAEVERGDIKLTGVEPGFFRTYLLVDRNAKYPANDIEDYAAQGKPKDMWAAYARRRVRCIAGLKIDAAAAIHVYRSAFATPLNQPRYSSPK